jgi:hypothetical protein
MGITAGPLRPDRWDFYLREFPDRLVADQILRGVREGFCLGYTGPRETLIPIIKHSSEEAATLRTHYNAEIDVHRAAGPFSQEQLEQIFPFVRVSFSFLIPKSDGSSRRIDNLSYPVGMSVNDHISKEAFPVQYSMPRDVHREMATCRTGTRMSSRDIKDAYRQVPVHPADWGLLVLRVQDDFYLTGRLSMGARPACGIFDRASRITCWIIRHELPSLECVRSILDDFLLLHGSYGLDLLNPRDSSLIDAAVVADLLRVDHIMHDLGWPIKHSKSISNVTQLTWLGIGWNSVEHSCFLPEDKAQRYLTIVEDILQNPQQRIRLTEWRSIMGKLVWVTSILPQARSRLFYLFSCLFAGERGLRRRRVLDSRVTDASVFVHMSEEGIHDLEWWRTVFLLPPIQRCLVRDTSPRICVTTDGAPSKRIGGYYGHLCFSINLSTAGHACHSTVVELLALVIAVILWGSLWEGETVRWRTDCSAHVTGLFKLRTSAPALLPLHQFLDLSAVKHNFLFSPEHIRGEHNGFADYLSRTFVTEAMLPPTFHLCQLTTPLPAWLSVLISLGD